MSLSIFNSIAIVKNIDMDIILKSLCSGSAAIQSKEVVRKQQWDYRKAVSSLYPIVDSRVNRFLAFTAKDDSLFLIANSPTGSAASITGPLPSRFDAETVDGFINYPVQLFDQSNCQMYKRTLSHFFLQVRRDREICRSIIAINKEHEQLYYANSGTMYDFENQRDYVLLEKNIFPPIEVLWKFSNYFGWPSPLSKEFLDNVKKCELLTFPHIKGSRERVIREDIQKKILQLPPSWLD